MLISHEFFEKDTKATAHYDLYLIKHSDEFYDLDIFEDMKNKICLIEWPEILNMNILTLEIIMLDETH